jgi:tRNA(fMet)-specific endonuclease VapC
MSYILDTDHISLYQHGYPSVFQKVNNLRKEQLFVTIISLEEQLRGRLAVIRNPQNITLPNAYRNFHTTYRFFSEMNVLDFDHRALTYYQNLKKQKIRIGSQDLKIAAIALTHKMTLTTRNTKDFCQMIGLTLEDWTT